MSASQMNPDYRPPIILTHSSLTHEDLDRCIEKMRKETVGDATDSEDEADGGLTILREVVHVRDWPYEELWEL